MHNYIPYLFILGGDDGEMQVIKTLLSQFGERWIQPYKGWDQKPIKESDIPESTIYRVIDTPALDVGGRAVTPIFVESTPDENLQKLLGVKILDHHGALAHNPPVIRQVVTLLDIWDRLSEPMKRWVELIGANDSAYIPGMEAMGATLEEIAKVRKFDRMAQGITQEQEKEAVRAMTMSHDYDNKWVFVQMAHNKCTPVLDASYGLHKNILIASPTEMNFFGDGALCKELFDTCGGWSGGSGLGKQGESAYWGCALSDVVTLDAVRGKVKGYFKE